MATRGGLRGGQSAFARGDGPSAAASGGFGFTGGGFSGTIPESNLAFLSPELQRLKFPNTQTEENRLLFPELTPRRLTLEETGLEGWGWDPDTGYTYRGVRVPGGPDSLQPIQDVGLAGRQADFAGVPEQMREQFIQDRQLGLGLGPAAAGAGVWNPYSFDMPPNIAGNPQLVQQAQQMADRARAQGASPDQIGQLMFQISGAVPPGYQDVTAFQEGIQAPPLWGYQNRGQTIGELGQQIGAYGPELQQALQQAPTGPVTTENVLTALQELEQRNPYQAYELRLRDYLNEWLAEGDPAMTPQVMAQVLEFIDRGRKAGIPIENMPYFSESRVNLGPETIQWFAQGGNQPLQGIPVGIGTGTGQGVVSGAGAARAPQTAVGQGVPPGIAGQPGVFGTQPQGQVRVDYYQYIKDLGIARELEDWMAGMFNELYNTWGTMSPDSLFIDFVEQYLGG